jgi:hypothetical protein
MSGQMSAIKQKQEQAALVTREADLLGKSSDVAIQNLLLILISCKQCECEHRVLAVV